MVARSPRHADGERPSPAAHPDDAWGGAWARDGASDAAANARVVRRFVEDVLNGADPDALDELVAPDVVDRAAPSGPPAGREGLRRPLAAGRVAFPDARLTMLDLIAQGDKVVVQWTMRGTHRGPLGRIGPTGRPIEVSGVNIERLAGGHIVEHWSVVDQTELFQQIGILPDPI